MHIKEVFYKNHRFLVRYGVHQNCFFCRILTNVNIHQQSLKRAHDNFILYDRNIKDPFALKQLIVETVKSYYDKYYKDEEYKNEAFKLIDQWNGVIN